MKHGQVQWWIQECLRARRDGAAVEKEIIRVFGREELLKCDVCRESRDRMPSNGRNYGVNRRAEDGSESGFCFNNCDATDSLQMIWNVKTLNAFREEFMGKAALSREMRPDVIVEIYNKAFFRDRLLPFMLSTVERGLIKYNLALRDRLPKLKRLYNDIAV